jgi:hypothetical protein
MFAGKSKSLPYSGAPERCFIRVGSGLANKHWISLKRFARVKHSSLLRKVSTYGSKKFYNIGSWPTFRDDADVGHVVADVGHDDADWPSRPLIGTDLADELCKIKKDAL